MARRKMIWVRAIPLDTATLLVNRRAGILRRWISRGVKLLSRKEPEHLLCWPGGVDSRPNALLCTSVTCNVIHAVPLCIQPE